MRALRLPVAPSAAVTAKVVLVRSASAGHGGVFDGGVAECLVGAARCGERLGDGPRIGYVNVGNPPIESSLECAVESAGRGRCAGLQVGCGSFEVGARECGGRQSRLTRRRWLSCCRLRPRRPGLGCL